MAKLPKIALDKLIENFLNPKTRKTELLQSLQRFAVLASEGTLLDYFDLYELMQACLKRNNVKDLNFDKINADEISIALAQILDKQSYEAFSDTIMTFDIINSLPQWFREQDVASSFHDKLYKFDETNRVFTLKFFDLINKKIMPLIIKDYLAYLQQLTPEQRDLGSLESFDISEETAKEIIKITRAFYLDPLKFFSQDILPVPAQMKHGTSAVDESLENLIKKIVIEEQEQPPLTTDAIKYSHENYNVYNEKIRGNSFSDSSIKSALAVLRKYKLDETIEIEFSGKELEKDAPTKINARKISVCCNAKYLNRKLLVTSIRMWLDNFFSDYKGNFQEIFDDETLKNSAINLISTYKSGKYFSNLTPDFFIKLEHLSKTNDFKSAFNNACTINLQDLNKLISKHINFNLFNKSELIKQKFSALFSSRDFTAAFKFLTDSDKKFFETYKNLMAKDDFATQFNQLRETKIFIEQLNSFCAYEKISISQPALVDFINFSIHFDLLEKFLKDFHLRINEILKKAIEDPVREAFDELLDSLKIENINTKTSKNTDEQPPSTSATLETTVPSSIDTVSKGEKINTKANILWLSAEISKIVREEYLPYITTLYAKLGKWSSLTEKSTNLQADAIKPLADNPDYSSIVTEAFTSTSKECTQLLLKYLNQELSKKKLLSTDYEECHRLFSEVFLPYLLNPNHLQEIEQALKNLIKTALTHLPSNTKEVPDAFYDMLVSINYILVATESKVTRKICEDRISQCNKEKYTLALQRFQQTYPHIVRACNNNAPELIKNSSLERKGSHSKIKQASSPSPLGLGNFATKLGMFKSAEKNKSSSNDQLPDLEQSKSKSDDSVSKLVQRKTKSDEPISKLTQLNLNIPGKPSYANPPATDLFTESENKPPQLRST